MKGFLKGFNLMILRDTPSYSLYFLTFELFRQNASKLGMDNELSIELLGGGIAGSVAW